MERESVCVTVCNFYLSELGGFCCEFFPFSSPVVVVEGTCWFPVAVWLGGFHSQPNSPWGRYAEGWWFQRRTSPFPSSSLTLVLKVTGFKHT